MLEVLISNTPGCLISADILDSMYRLRSATFAERMGWDVNSVQGRETDRFDEIDPTYMVVRHRAQPNSVLGCWRLLPTTGPYMLRDIFPELLDGHPVPSDPRVWEISRYAVAPAAHSARPGLGFGEISLALWRRLFTFSREAGIDAFVAVTNVSVERLVARLGITIERFAPPKRVGDAMSVAYRLPMDGRAEAALGPAREIAQPARAA